MDTLANLTSHNIHAKSSVTMLYIQSIELHLELSVPHIRAGNNSCMVAAGQDDQQPHHQF